MRYTREAQPKVLKKGRSCQAHRAEVGSKAQTLETGFRGVIQQASYMDKEVKMKKPIRGSSLPILVQIGVGLIRAYSNT